MENTLDDVKRLEREFNACQKILTAIGDETRQHLICIMLQGECGGDRVIDIAKKNKPVTTGCIPSYADIEGCWHSEQPKRRHIYLLLS